MYSGSVSWLKAGKNIAKLWCGMGNDQLEPEKNLLSPQINSPNCVKRHDSNPYPLGVLHSFSGERVLLGLTETISLY